MTQMNVVWWRQQCFISTGFDIVNTHGDDDSLPNDVYPDGRTRIPNNTYLATWNFENLLSYYYFILCVLSPERA